jgi:hypothetical protein
MAGLAVDKLPADLFRVLFEKSPGSLLIKTDTPRFTIVAASDAYIKTTLLTRDEVIGKAFLTYIMMILIKQPTPLPAKSLIM